MYHIGTTQKSLTSSTIVAYYANLLIESNNFPINHLIKFWQQANISKSNFYLLLATSSVLTNIWIFSNS